MRNPGARTVDIREELKERSVNGRAPRGLYAELARKYNVTRMYIRKQAQLLGLRSASKDELEHVQKLDRESL